MPFYIGDYLRDTQHLNAEKHGAYVLLIFAYWASGRPLPDDDEHLATIARMPLKRWRAIRPIIARFFRQEGDEWHHRRIDSELDRAKDNLASRSHAGRNAANMRWQKQSHAPRIDDAMRQNAPSPSPTPREDSEAIASAEKPPTPLDLKKAFWETGRAFLEANGVPHHRAGGLLGKWRRDHGEPAVVAAMAKAEAECPSEIESFIEGCLRNGRRPGKLSAAEGLYEGFARELGKREQQADRRAGGDPAQPLLDSRHGPEAAPEAKRGLAG